MVNDDTLLLQHGAAVAESLPAVCSGSDAPGLPPCTAPHWDRADIFVLLSALQVQSPLIA